MPRWLHPRAAYVHVPFCAHHCGYCDFAVTAGQDQLMTLYVEALGLELATLGEACPVDTVFIGGGTPTYLTPPLLERLLAEIRRWLPLNAGGEWSIEATPESLDAGKVALLADHGVTRVSIGAQSFHPHLLQRLERIHNPDDVARAVECVRERIAQVSLDLIFGVPGQSLDDWDRDLRRALTLQPEHVATYGLTYEKGTPLWKRWQGGQVQPLGEDDELEMYCRAMDVLTAAGFEHYEVSNFARPGRRCRHNQVYWANHAYFGFGVGAARYIQGRREMNTRDTHGYIRRVFAGDKPLLQAEELAPEERARETLALQLRRADGVWRGEFQEQTGFDLDALAGAKLRQHTALGLLEDNGACVRLTRSGKCVADTLMTELL